MEANTLFDYLVRISLQKYYQLFIENGVDLEILSMCDDDDLREIGIDSKEDRRLLTERFKETRKSALSRSSTIKNEVESVFTVLRDVGLESLFPYFQQREISLKDFLKLKESDLIKIGINLKGQRIKILRAIRYRYKSTENPMSIRRSTVTALNPLAANPSSNSSRSIIGRFDEYNSSSPSSYASSPTSISPFLDPSAPSSSSSPPYYNNNNNYGNSYNNNNSNSPGGNSYYGNNNVMPKPQSYEPITMLAEENISPFLRISTHTEHNQGLMSYEGYMYKKTVNKNSARKTLMGWKKYYFILNINALHAFKSQPYLEDREKPTASLSLRGALIDIQEDPNRKSVIRVNLSDGSVYLFSPKDEEFETWLDCFNLASV